MCLLAATCHDHQQSGMFKVLGVPVVLSARWIEDLWGVFGEGEFLNCLLSHVCVQ